MIHRTGPSGRERLLLLAAALLALLPLFATRWWVQPGRPGDPAAAPAPADQPLSLHTQPATQPGTNAPSPPPAAPTALRIARIHVDTSLIPLGLDGQGRLEVPEHAHQAGWYLHAAVPGDPGTAVIAGHVDSWQGAGVFFRLRELRAGDVIEVERSDGAIVSFVVRTAERYAKDAFPTVRVYGESPAAQLRLITCGGEFDARTRSYEQNLVVYADLLRGG